MGDANLVDFLNTDRLDAWFASTPEIATAANGFVLPAPREAPEQAFRCELRTAKGTRCRRHTHEICYECNKPCCGPHRIPTFSPGVSEICVYCRPCYRDAQRVWAAEERETARTKAFADFAESGPDLLGFEDFRFS